MDPPTRSPAPQRRRHLHRMRYLVLLAVFGITCLAVATLLLIARVSLRSTPTFYVSDGQSMPFHRMLISAMATGESSVVAPASNCSGWLLLAPFSIRSNALIQMHGMDSDDARIIAEILMGVETPILVWIVDGHVAQVERMSSSFGVEVHGVYVRPGDTVLLSKSPDGNWVHVGPAVRRRP